MGVLQHFSWARPEILGGAGVGPRRAELCHACNFFQINLMPKALHNGQQQFSDNKKKQQFSGLACAIWGLRPRSESHVVHSFVNKQKTNRLNELKCQIKPQPSNYPSMRSAVLFPQAPLILLFNFPRWATSSDQMMTWPDEVALAGCRDV